MIKIVKEILKTMIVILLGTIVLLIPYCEGYYAAKYDGINFFISMLLGIITLYIADLKSYLTIKGNER
ncbi:MAG: hypothetical protein NC489_19515 [Ruminococcus flavefaciens]|nr:hypothetical protein [Ruminococcus flavefaciens]